MPIDWPPDFYLLPGLNAGVAKADARPCPGRPGKPCGAWAFVVVETAAGGVSVACPNCCRFKDADRVVGTLDRRNWTFTPTRKETPWQRSNPT